MFSSASLEGVDPFYPIEYAGNSDLVAEKVDGCLSHPQRAGVLHYHSASTCIADKDSYQNTGPFKSGDVVDAMTEAFGSSLSYRSVFGLAKDGRPITPLCREEAILWTLVMLMFAMDLTSMATTHMLQHFSIHLL